MGPIGEVLTGIVIVVIGAVLLFTIANAAYVQWIPKRGWSWLAFVCALAAANMLIHRAVGNSINLPFFTALMFAITLYGHPDKDISWIKRGAVAIIVGTLLGWLTFASTGHV